MECPLCLSPKLYPTGIESSIWLKQGQIYRCSNCFSCVLQPLPDDSTLNAYYSKDWGNEVSNENCTSNLLLNIFSKIHISIKSSFRWPFIRPWLKKEFKILEIGAGHGGLCSFLAKKGFNVFALEPSLAFRHRLKRNGIQVVGSMLDDLPIGSKYDVVLAYHVLEHVNNPTGFLQKVRQFIRPKGILFGEVPNVPLIPKDLPVYFKKSIFLNVHLFHYSCCGMRHILEKAGLANVKCIEIGFRRGFIRTIFPRANFHLLHPSFQASKLLRLQSALHALESILLSKSAVVSRNGSRKGFIEPNDYILFSSEALPPRPVPDRDGQAEGFV